jgi:hypothetical protein
MVVLQCVKEDFAAQIKYAQHIQKITALIHLTYAHGTVTIAKDLTKLLQIIIKFKSEPYIAIKLTNLILKSTCKGW